MILALVAAVTFYEYGLLIIVDSLTHIAPDDAGMHSRGGNSIGLIDLPPELRNRVYELLFPDLDWYVLPRSYTPSESPTSSKEVRPGALQS